MTAPTMTRPQNAAAPASGKNAAPAPPPQPFIVGTYDTTTPDLDVTLAQTTAAQKLTTWKVSPNGWLSGMFFLFEATVTGQATNSVSYSKDNPFSLVQKVTFRDLGNREIFGPLTGYEWFTTNKWGGYFGGAAGSDPRNPNGAFTAVTGTGSTAGTFSFGLWLPLELVRRDSLGEIENKSSSSAYTVEIYIDSQANTYNQVPSVQASVRCRANIDGYTEPEASDSRGRPFSTMPPAAGTVQYWTSEIPQAFAAGAQKYNIQNGIGYSIRNIVKVGYDNSSGTRATVGLVGGTFPDPTTLTFGKIQLLQLPIRMWLNKMAEWYRLFSAAGTADTYGGPENGVLAYPFNRDFSSEVGEEMRNDYLMTKAGNVLQDSGSYGAATIVHYLINYVVPPGNDAGRLRQQS